MNVNIKIANVNDIKTLQKLSINSYSRNIRAIEFYKRQVFAEISVNLETHL